MTPSGGRDTSIKSMRALVACSLAFVAMPLLGCATTVHRMSGGEVTLPAGDPQNACEKRGWLVLAPTSREVPTKGESVTVEDGLGMYKIGSTDPESIPGYEEDIGPSPIVTRHKEGVAPHDRDRIIASGLGVLAVASIAVGSALFVTGLSRTKTVTNPETGLREEEADIDGKKAGWGAGIAVVGGFGFGAAGLTVNPNAAERAEADAWRYVYTPDDDHAAVKTLINRHNLSVRKRCGGAVAPDAADDVTEPAPEDTPVDEASGGDDETPAPDTDAEEEDPLARAD